MKKLFLILLIFGFGSLFSQAPPKVNYQGIARDASGMVIKTGTIALKFEIFNSGSTETFVETQSSTVSPSGVFVASIGSANTIGFSAITWTAGPYTLKVSADPSNGTSYSIIGQQEIMSVPYALYAQKSGGGALPTGTITGQTLFWDNISSSWRVDNNLTNNGIRSAIGVSPLGLPNLKNRLSVFSGIPGDSSAILGYRHNALALNSGIKGVVSGNVPSSSTLSVADAIFGGLFNSVNFGNGLAIGGSGMGISGALGGYGIGLMGVGNSAVPGSFAIGVFGTTDPTSVGTRFAGYFKDGGVVIQDSLFIGGPGNIGDVLVKTSANGRAKWQNITGGPGPWTKTTNAVHLSSAAAMDNVVIGKPGPALGMSSRLSIWSPTVSVDTAVSIFQFNARPALFVKQTANAPAISVLNNPAGTGDLILLTNNSSFSSAIRILNQSSTSAPAIDIQGMGGGKGIFVTTVKNNAIHAESNDSAAVIVAKSNFNGLDPVALRIVNGHFQALGATSIGPTIAVTVGTLTALGAIYSAPSNDVRGVISATINPSGGAGIGDAFDVTVTFNKMYTSAPIVVVSPLKDTGKMSWFIKSINQSTFTVTFVNSTGSFIPSIPPVYKFNYFVIE